eukprot:143965-Prymnesium_polylepis.1
MATTAEVRYYIAIGHRAANAIILAKAREILAETAAEGHTQSQYDLAMLHDEGVGAARGCGGGAAAVQPCSRVALPSQALCNLGIFQSSHEFAGRRSKSIPSISFVFTTSERTYLCTI